MWHKALWTEHLIRIELTRLQTITPPEAPLHLQKFLYTTRYAKEREEIKRSKKEEKRGREA